MLISREIIVSKIFLIRAKRVMLDKDLAKLYDVKTKVFNQAVKRNIKRFSEDFMFQLTKKELEDWRPQFVTSNSERIGLRRRPLAFTDYGILMLSSVLKSSKAIKVNIQIMKAFVKLREMVFNYKELAQKAEVMECKYDKHFPVVFEAIKELIKQEQNPRKKIGFHEVYACS